MSGKQAAETRHALQLHKSGKSAYEASRIAGIAPSTLYRSLKSKRKKKLAKIVA